MIILLILSFLAQGQKCPQYECKKLDDNMCVMASGSNVFIDPCKKGEYCDQQILPSPSYCKQNPDNLPYAWPGEPCKSAQCKYGYCNGSRCVGQSHNETCSLDDECEPGLYCKKGFCKDLKSEGDSGCKSDYECEYTCGCMNGKCTYYNSIHEGSKVECVNNRSEFCISGACYKDYCLGEMSNNKGEGAECEDDGDCINNMYNTSIYPFLFYSKCKCGYSGKKYCDLFPADQTFYTYRWALFDWIDSGHIDGCNTVRRFAPYCIEKKWHMNRYIKLMYYTYKVQNFTEIKNAENCVLKTLLPDYVEYDDLRSFSMIQKVLGALLVLNL